MKGNPKSKRVLLTEKQKQIMRENASPDMTIAELRRLADVNTINTAHSFVARENLPHKIVGRGRSDPYEQERRKTEIMKLADQGYEARDIEVMIGRTYEIIVRTVRVVTGMSFGVYRKTCVLPFLETSREPEPERTPCMLLVEKWPLCRDQHERLE